MGGAAVRPFQVAVGDDVLDDLAGRLDRVRWPDEIPGSAGTWEYGTDLGYLKELVPTGGTASACGARGRATNGFPSSLAGVGAATVTSFPVEATGRAPCPLCRCLAG